MTKIDASLEENKRRMEELVKLLNEAGRAYYQEAREIMSNYEYDRLYDELVALEDKLHTTLAASPTVHVGYEVVSELPKERHERPMLSLDKTKEVERLKEFLGDQKALISWKMDGLTIVLTYRDGALYKAVTRGNGEIGEKHFSAGLMNPYPVLVSGKERPRETLPRNVLTGLTRSTRSVNPERIR